MARALESDLTQGSIASHFRQLAVPGALGMLFNTLYNIVDMYFAGLLGTSAQAGIALGFQAFYISLSVGVGLGGAMGALVGNALGAKNKPSARRTAAQGLAFGAIAAIVLALAGLWFGPAVIALVSEPGAYREAGIRYYTLLTLAMPAFFMAFACNGILQAHGDGVSMQRALMVAFLANIGLNPLFIFGIPGVCGGMGFDGLAASTVASQMGVMVFMIARVLRLPEMKNLKPRNFRPRAEKFRDIALQTLPIAASMLIMFVSGFVVQYALKGFGEHAIAGFALGIRLEQILLLPVLGVTGALLPIVSQNFGARDYDRVREALFYCWRIGFIMMAIAVPLIWIASGFVLSFFTDDPEVIRVGIIYMRIDGSILPFYMMLFSINSFLQALKRPIVTVWISLYRQGFGVAFFIWVYVGLVGLDEHGVWFGVATAVITGWMISLWLAARVARQEMGGLWPARMERA